MTQPQTLPGMCSNQVSYNGMLTSEDNAIGNNLLRNEDTNKQTTDGRCFETCATTTENELVEKETADWTVDKQDSLENLSDAVARVTGVSETGTVVGSVSIERSSEVHVGDTVIYNGPVTIQQYPVGEENCNSKKDKFRTRKAALLDFLQLRKHLVCKTVTILSGTLAVLFIIFVFQLFSKVSTEDGATSGTTEDDSEVALILVDRIQWGGRPPNYTHTLPLELPSTRVIIIHKTFVQPCFHLEKCSFLVRWLQDVDMNLNELDNIGNNFLVGGDGRIYVGRGWKMEGMHTSGFNKRSIGVAFIGNFEPELPPAKSLKAAQLLLDEGVKQNLLSANYKLFGHRQLVNTSTNPGEALYKEIQSWQHWTANV